MSRVNMVKLCMQALKDNTHLNAFISTRPEQALLEEAESADLRSKNSASLKSPIDGQIIAVKDNICTIELPTTCASEMLRGYISPYEATVVQNLKNAGAIIMGKTNMDEFGMGSHSIYSAFGAVSGPSPTAIPQKSAGGSSGGSATAVASGMCDAYVPHKWFASVNPQPESPYSALGTDTGGSVRLPASYCGVVGFKPSYGMLSRWGVVAYANSLDTVGIMGRRVSGVEKIFAAINNHDPNDPTSLSNGTRERIQAKLKRTLISNKTLRIGVPEEYNVEELTPSVRKTWEKVIEGMRRLGHKIFIVSLPHTKHALSAYYVLAPAEASSNLAKYDGVRYGHREEQDRSEKEQTLFAPTRQSGFGDEVRRRILMGAYALSSKAKDNYFIQAQKVRRLVQQDFDNNFVQPNWLTFNGKGEDLKGERVDVIITPCSLSMAPLLEDVMTQRSPLDSYVNDVLTVPASLAGIPAISIPFRVVCGKKSKEKLPIGIQIMAQFGDENMLWRAAKIVEELSSLATRR